MQQKWLIGGGPAEDARFEMLRYFGHELVPEDDTLTGALESFSLW